MIGIYEIVNIVNGKRYVGQTAQGRGIGNRLSQHRRNLRLNVGHENSYLQHAWNKYGESAFEFRVLEECFVERLNEREELWQECCPFELYNKRIIPCSNRGVRNVKNSIALRGRVVWNKGKRMSIEVCEINRQAQLKRFENPEHCDNISKGITKWWARRRIMCLTN